MKNKIFKNIFGFTLIEMLVVISIIGILATLGFVSYTTSQKQARDVSRKSDLKQYQTSLENYANSNNNYYPISASVDDPDDLSSMCNELGIGGECPDDPKTDLYNYNYISDASGTEYLIWSILETGDYFAVCSGGKTGPIEAEPETSVCPL